MLLENTYVRLRAPEPEDLEFYYLWENDTSLWISGDTHLPYSRFELKQFIDSESGKDFYTSKQIRFTVETSADKVSIGVVDLFDFSPFHRRAAVGVLIDRNYQNKGFAIKALNLLCEYAFDFLKLHQLYAHVPENNLASKKMLERCGFYERGLLTDWLQTKDGYQNVYFLSAIADTN